MNAADARARIEFKTQWEAKPALTVAEVDWLLVQARATDSSGVEPDDSGYLETYTAASVQAAINEGFALKEAKVAAEFDVSTAMRSQQAAALRRLRGGGLGSLTIGPGMIR